jgi:hypothetical protein
VALITIDGEPLPDPDEYRLDAETLGGITRNAEGGLVGDIIGVKAKITAAWNAMAEADYRRLIAAAEGIFARAELYDPSSGGLVPLDVSVSGVSGRMVTRASGVWWKAGLTLEER